jgi:hypothetical protein
MASLDADDPIRGVVIELDHNETQKLINLGGDKAELTAEVGGIVSALGVSAVAAPYVVAAVVAHMIWERTAIEKTDKGWGVILTCPYFAPGVAIPATRYERHLPLDWASMDAGTFVSSGNDVVEWSIQHGVVGADVAEFRLDNQEKDGTRREFRLRDGLGGEWTVQAKYGAQAGNGLYTDQLGNGQKFTFRKPQISVWPVDYWIDAFDIEGINLVKGGDRVTFTWRQ